MGQSALANAFSFLFISIVFSNKQEYYVYIKRTKKSKQNTQSQLCSKFDDHGLVVTQVAEHGPDSHFFVDARTTHLVVHPRQATHQDTSVGRRWKPVSSNLVLVHPSLQSVKPHQHINNNTSNQQSVLSTQQDTTHQNILHHVTESHHIIHITMPPTYIYTHITTWRHSPVLRDSRCGSQWAAAAAGRSWYWHPCARCSSETPRSTLDGSERPAATEAGSAARARRPVVLASECHSRFAAHGQDNKTHHLNNKTFNTIISYFQVQQLITIATKSNTTNNNRCQIDSFVDQ